MRLSSQSTLMLIWCSSTDDARFQSSPELDDRVRQMSARAVLGIAFRFLMRLTPREARVATVRAMLAISSPLDGGRCSAHIGSAGL